MIFNDTVFQALSFFTLGFLCLIGLISLVLNYYFKSKAYGYYLVFIISTILFVLTVIIKQEKIWGYDSNYQMIISIINDILRVLIFYFHTLFIFKSMVIENNKLKKLNWLMNLYFLIVVSRIVIAIISPELMSSNQNFFVISRVFVISISLVINYYLYKEFSNTYLRFLFIASTILLVSVFLSLFDSSHNNHSNTLSGFIFFCVGIILENICFVSAFIFQIIKIDSEKKLTEILHQEQLITVQLEMQQQTMEHIGREIHDNIGQKLTLASLYTQQLAYENKAPLVNNSIENISEIINQSLKELRELSKSLTSNHTQINTINQLLQLECNRFNELKRCRITYNSNSKGLDLTYNSKSVLLRISQEFIQNSIKHSDCVTINVSLKVANNNLQLCLQDDGKGFDINRNNSGGIGLNNIKKRVEIIGGVYDLESTKKGTKLIIEIPL